MKIIHITNNIYQKRTLFYIYSVFINIYTISVQEKPLVIPCKRRLDISHKWLRIIWVRPVHSQSHNHLIWIGHVWFRKLVKFFHLQKREKPIHHRLYKTRVSMYTCVQKLKKIFTKFITLWLNVSKIFKANENRNSN